ncbi:hypothetical protein LX59_02751 [Azomonas agilis]|uniref:UrcA family protein n=1 Tax=Azomonas agilis TaxID=116849 RepID=A0A562HZ77_9GAMM|nr:hypothetical protein [Azomonas agilis]TWH64077.1 hypothetical protein LX59_02751 [Azomonas agilis]
MQRSVFLYALLPLSLLAANPSAAEDDFRDLQGYQPTQYRFETPYQYRDQYRDERYQDEDYDRHDRDNDRGSSCHNRRQHAAVAGARLAEQARRLRICAESKDLRDDCGSEYRRVTNAHSDYDEAISLVRKECR